MQLFCFPGREWMSVAVHVFDLQHVVHGGEGHLEAFVHDLDSIRGRVNQSNRRISVCNDLRNRKG